jgi:hypothetical protein
MTTGPKFPKLAAFDQIHPLQSEVPRRVAQEAIEELWAETQRLMNENDKLLHAIRELRGISEES